MQFPFLWDEAWSCAECDQWVLFVLLLVAKREQPIASENEELEL